MVSLGPEKLCSCWLMRMCAFLFKADLSKEACSTEALLEGLRVGFLLSIDSSLLVAGCASWKPKTSRHHTRPRFSEIVAGVSWKHC